MKADPADRPASAEQWANELERAVSFWKRPFVRIATGLALAAIAARIALWHPDRRSEQTLQNQFMAETVPVSEPSAVARVRD
jgi:hypothetical protein